MPMFKLNELPTHHYLHKLKKSFTYQRYFMSSVVAVATCGITAILRYFRNDIIDIIKVGQVKAKSL